MKFEIDHEIFELNNEKLAFLAGVAWGRLTDRKVVYIDTREWKNSFNDSEIVPPTITRNERKALIEYMDKKRHIKDVSEGVCIGDDKMYLLILDENTFNLK